jgi:uncharacterized damage-inducible protein DinB
MKNSEISSLIEQFTLQTRLFNNLLKDVDSANYNKKPNSTTNSYAWLAGHVLNTRYTLANIIGLNLSSPYNDLYANFRAFDPKLSYPDSNEVKEDWDKLSEKLITGFNSLNDEFINAPAPFKVPIGDNTMKGFIAFFAHHEAYHLGQLGYLRRYLGIPAMSYD